MDPVQPPPPHPSKPIYKRVWFGSSLGLVILLIGAGAVWFFFAQSSQNNLSPEDRFYAMMETAGTKTKIHFSYEIVAPETERYPAIYSRTTSEYDVAAKNYSSVAFNEGNLRLVYRCVNNTPYESKDMRFPKTRADVEKALAGAWKAVDRDPVSDACTFTRSRYNGNVADGILPVGITTPQVQNMIASLKKRDALLFTNQGEAVISGKKGVKIGFEIKESKDASIFFFSLRDGTTDQVGGNGIPLDDISSHFEERFFRTTPWLRLKGFYVIDPKTNLPLYSQFTTIPADSTQSPNTHRAIYAYPDTLSLTTSTPIEALPPAL